MSEEVEMKPLVYQTDFGMSDGAVSAMYGVALKVSPELKIYDLTHDIEPYNIWEAGYRLLQTVTYWPEGTVFVSVVDPGVGSDRRSVVVKLLSGQLIVTPDNGTLTFLKKRGMIAAARLLDEENNRLKGSEESYTFYGRDVYAYTGARLAAELIPFSEAGEEVAVSSIIEMAEEEPYLLEDGSVCGTIDVLDVRFGSLWTNIPLSLFRTLGIGIGERLEVVLSNEKRTVYRNTMQYAKSFASVYVGEPLVYANSLSCMAVAINQGSFAKAYTIGTGNSWHIVFRKIN